MEAAPSSTPTGHLTGMVTSTATRGSPPRSLPSLQLLARREHLTRVRNVVSARKVLGRAQSAWASVWESPLSRGFAAQLPGTRTRLLALAANGEPKRDHAAGPDLCHQLRRVDPVLEFVRRAMAKRHRIPGSGEIGIRCPGSDRHFSRPQGLSRCYSTEQPGFGMSILSGAPVGAM